MKGSSVGIDPRLALDAWLSSVDDLLADQAVAPDESLLLRKENDDPPQLIGKLWARLRKERDLELHVRVGWQFGVEYLQLLDFVPSTGRYETSVLIERHLLSPLLPELAAYHRYAGD